MPNHLIHDLRALASGLPEDLKQWPHIPCPTCERGRLKPREDSFTSDNYATFLAAMDADGIDPDWVQGSFHCLLSCTAGPICDVVRIVGDMGLEREVDAEGMWDGGSWTFRLYPQFFLPALPLVENEPPSHSEAFLRLGAAAKVLWVDPNSAANRLRTSIEALMDDEDVPRHASDKHGNPSYDKEGNLVERTLHNRIEKFKELQPQHADTADLLMAIKWLGNEGSHRDSLNIGDVLDGVEILDHALGLLYNKTSEKLKLRAAEITARKGAPARRNGRG